MVIDLLAVFDDGARPVDPKIPTDLRRALTIAVGESFTFRVLVKTAAGAPFRAITGDILLLTARTPASPGQRRLFQKTGTKMVGGWFADGTYEFTGTPADTMALGDIRRAFVDIRLTRSGGAAFVIFPSSTLTLGI